MSEISDQQKKDFELGIKLESIFMPYARKQRNEAYQKDTTSADMPEAKFRCVHYTTAEAALSIIKNKCLWMRNATCMSDYREVQHGYDILRKFFSNSPSNPQKLKKEALLNAIDSCASGAAVDAINQFDKWWNNIQLNTFITSISAHDNTEDSHGRLSMWRAFGGVSARVAIVFDVPWFTGSADVLKIMFSPVAYLKEDDVYGVLEKITENINNDLNFLRSLNRELIVNIVFRTLLAGATCLKHEGFLEEREWRAIYFPHLYSSPLMYPSTEIIQGVPQVIYKFPLDSTVSSDLEGLEFSNLFDRLIIGPSSYPYAMHDAFLNALKDAGVTMDKQQVFISGIPIRT